MLRDILLSYCPLPLRRIHRPESTVRLQHLATITSLLQMLLFGALLMLSYKSFLALRARQFPQLTSMHEAVQAQALFIFSLDFLLHPLTLILLYFVLEGCVRFFGGLVFSEIVPGFPAFAGYKISTALRNRRQAKEQQRNAVSDLVEWLADGRIRIASCIQKPTWNPSITIGIGGKWYELERQQQGPLPRPYTYVLRPAPPGKI